MALNNIQERVERSIFEALRLVAVREGYTPDITLSQFNTGVAATDQANWSTAEAAIVSTNGFAVGIYGHSSSENKGIRKTPRITIIPRRIMPGSIGNPPMGGYQASVLDPLQIVLVKPPFDSSDLGLDIYLTSSSAKQDRVIHQLLNAAIGTRNYLQMYDKPNERFFIKQYNYQDVPDTIEGEEEKIYSYEVPDLYLSDGQISAPIKPIIEITVDTDLQTTVVDEDATFIHLT